MKFHEEGPLTGFSNAQLAPRASHLSAGTLGSGLLPPSPGAGPAEGLPDLLWGQGHPQAAVSPTDAQAGGHAMQGTGHKGPPQCLGAEPLGSACSRLPGAR